MASVTFEKAQRWYPGADVPAVPGIDLEIKDGEVGTDDIATIPLELRSDGALRRVEVNGEVAEFSAGDAQVLVRPRRILRAGGQPRARQPDSRHPGQRESTVGGAGGGDLEIHRDPGQEGGRPSRGDGLDSGTASGAAE